MKWLLHVLAYPLIAAVDRFERSYSNLLNPDEVDL